MKHLASSQSMLRVFSARPRLRLPRKVVSLMPRFIRACCADQHGISAIEFAIAAPFFLMMLLGTFELSFDLMMDAGVQMAAQSASRYGMTTVTPSTGTRDSQIKSIVMGILSPWTNLAGTTVTITESDYSTYGDITASNSTTGAGGLGDIVAYSISLKTPGITGMLQVFGVPSLTFQRSYIVQNEE